MVGWLLTRQARVSQSRLDTGTGPADAAYYQGKIASAAFFAAEVLPRLATDRAVIEAGTFDAMSVHSSFL
ncbi:acyl-CoA dehydrogenase C-terminal domain-containing protein [Actinokineospora sp. HUAS TT18]|uniref:acyl-CoA dehydrogenase C-terminal domain-containing protein n=1 Tax=Actinokineospora sp. HUAS TT18 TaxID=3447451 RepID=UPI003F524C64